MALSDIEGSIKAKGAIAWGRKQLGSGKWAGACQMFVRMCFTEGAKMPAYYVGSATNAWKKWGVSKSKTNIPVGACVYFESKVSPKDGHVGIYIGNGQVLHTFPSVVIYDINRCGVYRGWGWYGGIALASTSSDFTGTSGKIDGPSTTYGTTRDKSLGDITIDTGGTSSGSSSSGKMSIEDAQAYGGTTITIADKTGAPEKIQVYHAQSKNSIDKWGLLRYFEEISTPSIGQNKAATLLELYNRKTRKLTVSDAFGDPNVRAGTLIPVKLDLGDIVTNNYMLVEKVTHKFRKDKYTMNLELEGAWSD